MKTVAYLRVSTPQQDASSQRLAILEYARKHDLHIDDFIEATASGQASEKRRRLDELTNALQPGDRLVVSELSRLGRSLGQVVAVLDALAKAGVVFVALKENIRVEGKRDIQTKVMTTLFALFAEVERDLISERTRDIPCLSVGGNGGSAGRSGSVGALSTTVPALAGLHGHAVLSLVLSSHRAAIAPSMVCCITVHGIGAPSRSANAAAKSATVVLPSLQAPGTSAVIRRCTGNGSRGARNVASAVSTPVGGASPWKLDGPFRSQSEPSCTAVEIATSTASRGQAGMVTGSS